MRKASESKASPLRAPSTLARAAEPTRDHPAPEHDSAAAKGVRPSDGPHADALPDSPESTRPRIAPPCESAARGSAAKCSRLGHRGAPVFHRASAKSCLGKLFRARVGTPADRQALPLIYRAPTRDYAQPPRGGQALVCYFKKLFGIKLRSSGIFSRMLIEPKLRRSDMYEIPLLRSFKERECQSYKHPAPDWAFKPL